MTERYRKELISKNLKEVYGINLIVESGKEDVSLIEYKRKKLEIPSPKGWIYDYGMSQIGEIVNKKLKDKREIVERPTEIYANLTNKEFSSKLERILNLLIVISFIGFLFFFLEEITVTGFMIYDIPSRVSSIGIFSFFVMIILLHLFKFKYENSKKK
jgi:hypothetical protein